MRNEAPRWTAVLVVLGLSVCWMMACSDAGESDRSRTTNAVVDGAVACLPPDTAPAARRQTVAPSSLIGTFRMTVVATNGSRGDTIAYGILHIDTIGALGPVTATSAVSFPLAGYSTVDLAEFGPTSLAHSPASRAPNRPGVQVLWNTSAASLRIVFGNTTTSEGRGIDAGVYFDPSHVSQLGFGGTWVDGGRANPNLGGFYCAERIP